MSISLHTNYNLDPASPTFDGEWKTLLKAAENHALWLYSLGVGGDTSGLLVDFEAGTGNVVIGYGYDLAQNGGQRSVDDLIAAGAVIDDPALLEARIDALIPGAATPEQVAALQLLVHLPTEATATALLDVAVNRRKQELETFLRNHQVNSLLDGALNLRESRETAVLLSMWYQTPAYLRVVDKVTKVTSMTNLTQALKLGDRAEAWFEIRYGSSKNGQDGAGTVRRRFRDAQVFGLYDDAAAVDPDEANKIYRMLQFHRVQIQAYELNFSAHIAAANTQFRLVGTSDQILGLENNLRLAQEKLFEGLRNKYASLFDLNPDDFISTNVYLDPGRDRNEAVGTLHTDHSATLIAAKYDASGNELAFRDVLIGEDGVDYLLGGKGDDILIGGKGDDIYYWRTGDGNDRIIEERDVDGVIRGRIVITTPSGSTIQSLAATGLFVPVQGQANTWSLPGSGITLTHQSPWKIVTSSGESIDLGDDFQDGDFGIDLFDPLYRPQTTRTITGDFEPLDNDPNEPGVQTTTDDLGNLVVTDTPAPNRDDMLFDSVGSDLIDAGGGNDVISAFRGGDDWIKGGAGRDDIGDTGGGNDYIEAGANGIDEGDIVFAGSGNDTLFADEAPSDFSAAFSAALDPNAQGSGLKGDFLSSGDGGDVVLGGSGNEVLMGGAGADVLAGGAGDDTLYGDDEDRATTLDWTVSRTNTGTASSPNYVVSFTGTTPATPSSVEGADALYGGAGNDWIFAQGGDDYVDAGQGDDVLFGDAGNDVLIGGAGNDFLDGDSATAVAQGLAGDDFLDGGDGNDTLVGEAGKDILYGGEGDDVISGGDGADILYGGPGLDVLAGGAGKDTYVFNIGDGLEVIDDAPVGPDDPEGSVLVLGPGIRPEDVKFRLGSLVVDIGNGDAVHFLGFDGDDPLATPVLDAIEFQSGGYMTFDDVLAQGFDIDGTEGDDVIQGTAVTDRINAFGGNDDIYAKASDDTIDAGAGNDIVEAGAGNDTITTGAGADIVFGGAGDDTVFARDGDLIIDTEGTNQLDLTAYTGLTQANLEITQYQAPDGEIYLNFHIRDDLNPGATPTVGGVSVQKGELGTFATVTVDDSAGGTVALSHAQLMQQYTGHGLVYDGSGAAKTLIGTPFADTFFGGAGADTIQAGSGDDRIDGGAAEDVLEGGAGNDTYVLAYNGARDTVIEDGAAEPNALHTVQLDAGISSAQVKATRMGDDLEVRLKATADALVIKDFYLQPGSWQSGWQVKDANGVTTALTDYVPVIPPAAGNWLSEEADAFRARREQVFAANRSTEGYNALGGNAFQRTEQVFDYALRSSAGSTTTRALEVQLLNTSDSSIFVSTDFLSTPLAQTSGGFDIGLPIAGASGGDRAGVSAAFATGGAPSGQGSEFIATGSGSLGLSGSGIQLGAGDYAVPVYQPKTGNTGGIRNSGGVDYANAGSFNDSSLWELAGFQIIHAGSGGGGEFGREAATATYFNYDQRLTVTDVVAGPESSSIFVDDASVVEAGDGDDNIALGAGFFFAGPDWERALNPDFAPPNISNFATHQGERKNNLGAFVDAGAGADTITGSFGQDTIAGGTGGDQMDGREGSDRYLLAVGDTGTDSIVDRGSDQHDYHNWFYWSRGVFDWEERLEHGNEWRVEFDGFGQYYDSEEEADAAIANQGGFGKSLISPLSELAPTVNWADGTATTQLISAGVMAQDTVEFGPGISQGDLTFSWDQETIEVQSLDFGLENVAYAILEISWGLDSSVRIAMPRPDDLLGFGIERFRFADGATLSLADMIALAPAPAPDFGPATLVEGTPFLDIFGGTSRNDEIYGYGGHDSIFGGWGADLLVGGDGDDRLIGFRGSDTYLFAPGDGNDTINDGGESALDVDILRLTGGLTTDDVGIERDAQHLYVHIWSSNEVLTLEDWFVDQNARIERVEFDDATVWSAAELESLAEYPGIDVIGTEGDDSLNGTPGYDFIQGLGGNDTLNGGPEDDYLDGGVGNDTYLFAPGDGMDEIGDSGGIDVLQFGAGISPGSVLVTRDPYSLVFLPGGQGDRVSILDWFSDAAYKVELVQFADGTTWDIAEVESRIAQAPATALNDLLTGDSGANRIDGLGGDDYLYGLEGNDILEGGAGDDLIEGGAGNNVLLGGEGADYLYSEAPGAEFVVGGVGDDDTLSVNADGGIIAFNAGDGHDWSFVDQSLTFTLSFGGTSSSQIYLSRDGTDVLIQIGTADSLAFSGPAVWPQSSWPIATLQIFDGDVRTYDFNAVMQEFLEAEAMQPGLSNWSAEQALAANLLTTSSTHALGGAIAYEYATTGGVAGLSTAQMHSVAGEAEFGFTPQPISLPSGNSAPTLDNPLADQTANEDSPFSFSIAADAFSDPDAGDTLTYAATLADGSALPAWLSFDGQTRTFSGTPLQANVGAIDVKVTATDPSSASVADLFRITVANTNDAPTVANPIADQSATEDAAFSFTVPGDTFADEDLGDGRTYSATLADGSALPGWLGFNVETRTFSGMPANGDVGGLDIKVTATDSAASSVADTFTLTVANTNDAPTVASPIPDHFATETEAWTYTVPTSTFSDPDAGDTLAYSASLADGTPLPAWLSFDAQTRTFSGTPPDTAAGVLTMRVTATDNGSASAFDDFDLDIANVVYGTESIDDLIGGSLRDVMHGFGGDDRLDGGLGADVMIGGDGSDYYVVDNVDDVVIEGADEGNDIVYSYVSWVLGPNVELLVLDKASGAINGTGNDLDNSLIGTVGSNILIGRAGNDYINGSAGIDILIGGPGDDLYFVGHAETQVIEYANEGIDTIWISGNSISWTLGDNIENLRLNGGNFDGTGNELDNILMGSSDANTLTGLGGNDTLGSGGGPFGADILIGGTGNDTYVLEGSGEQVIENADEGIDSVSSPVTWTLSANFENLTLTGTNAISGTGNALDNVLTGNSASNTLNGGLGADVMIGGDGGDIYIVDNVGDVVIENAGEGVDYIRSIVSWTLGPNIERLILEKNSPAIYGTGNELDNFLYGSNQASVLTGGAGDDYLEGNFGADTLIGGPGNDTYMVDDARYQIIEYADEGIDWVWMGDAQTSWTLGDNLENLRLNGGAFDATGNELDNILIGSSSANTLTGLGGSDTLDGFFGADILIGGTGNDSYILYGSGEQVIENADEGIDSVSSSATWTLSANFENLTLRGINAISGTGNALDNVLTGNTANNTLNGGAGNDWLNGGAGSDTLIGDTGDDTFVVDSAGDAISENAGAGTDSVHSSITYTLGSNLENLTLIGTATINGTGNTATNVLTGNDASNVLSGLDGADTLDGRGGSDILVGGKGDDTYLLGRGYGAEVIQENDTKPGTDVAQFLTDIAPEQVWFQQSGIDLVVTVIGTPDQFTVQNWYSGSRYRVEQFRTDDGQTLLESQVQNLVDAMAAFAPPAPGQTDLPPDYAAQLNPTIAANWQ